MQLLSSIFGFIYLLFSILLGSVRFRPKPRKHLNRLNRTNRRFHLISVWLGSLWFSPRFMFSSQSVFGFRFGFDPMLSPTFHYVFNSLLNFIVAMFLFCVWYLDGYWLKSNLRNDDYVRVLIKDLIKSWSQVKMSDHWSLNIQNIYEGLITKLLGT